MFWPGLKRLRWTSFATIPRVVCVSTKTADAPLEPFKFVQVCSCPALLVLFVDEMISYFLLPILIAAFIRFSLVCVVGLCL